MDPKLKVCFALLATTNRWIIKAKLQASLSVITSISDFKPFVQMLTIFNRSINLGDDDAERWNPVLHFVMEECIGELTNKVGYVGPIIGMIAVLFENVPTTATVARAIVAPVYQTSQLVASIPNLLYQKKAFLEALFQQLLLAMSHPDPNIRGGSHRIFFAIHMPTIICPWSILAIPLSFNGYNPRNTFGSTLRLCLLKNHFGNVQTQGIQCQWIPSKCKGK
ncbi:uncharacterized protein LOC141825632 [Curcuma longa]|uniref:uncharacterized protein LOC141825632 n=1 Tax=Curcuma longa TaxID=136217 RepID=UPI003D9DFEF6